MESEQQRCQVERADSRYHEVEDATAESCRCVSLLQRFACQRKIASLVVVVV